MARRSSCKLATANHHQADGRRSARYLWLLMRPATAFRITPGFGPSHRRGHRSRGSQRQHGLHRRGAGWGVEVHERGHSVANNVNLDSGHRRSGNALDRRDCDSAGKLGSCTERDSGGHWRSRQFRGFLFRPRHSAFRRWRQHVDADSHGERRHTRNAFVQRPGRARAWLSALPADRPARWLQPWPQPQKV